MGLSLKTAAQRFSGDEFTVWDPTTNTFGPTTIKGKRFRIDRFTTIYHRPTRRSYIRLLDPSFPGVGVIKRVNGGEIYLISETLNTDIEAGDLRYEDLRMSHLVTPPSGGYGTFMPVRTTGTGEDLGPVDLSTQIPVYLDLEFQSAINIEEAVDETIPRMILNHSTNAAPLPGDIFQRAGRTFIVNVPYIDGGLQAARVSELPIPYTTLTYRVRTGTGGYDPVTGTVTQGVTDRLFSGIIGRIQRDTEQSVTTPSAPTKIDLYVYEHHVGFNFALGNQILHEGTAYYIAAISQRREKVQWKLELTR
jgi:hypothetical protein